MDSREEVTDQDARIGGFIHEKGKGCVLVMNKWDLVEKDTDTMMEIERKGEGGVSNIFIMPPSSSSQP